jgi:hypothetical protein
MSVADMHAIDQPESFIAIHQTSHREATQELYKMANEKIQRFRDMLDDARLDVSGLTQRDHDPLEALESRNRSYVLWQARTNEVKAHGSAIFLPHKLRGDETWYVQVLWLDGSDEHPVSFRTDREALSWIHTDSPNWLKSRAPKIA